MCFPSVVFNFKKKCSEWQIFFRAFRVEVFLNASAKSSHSGGPLGRHQVLFSQNSMKFYQNWIGSFSAVSRNFWVFSSGSSRECLYFAVSQRKTPKFEPQTFVAALLRVDVRSNARQRASPASRSRKFLRKNLAKNCKISRNPARRTRAQKIACTRRS